MPFVGDHSWVLRWVMIYFTELAESQLREDTGKQWKLVPTWPKSSVPTIQESSHRPTFFITYPNWTCEHKQILPVFKEL